MTKALMKELNELHRQSASPAEAEPCDVCLAAYARIRAAEVAAAGWERAAKIIAEAIRSTQHDAGKD